MRWSFFLTPPAEGAYNMALDEALMRRAARTGNAVFRVYSWSAPVVSLGRNQRARGCYDQMEARRRGIRFVRRPTGGRALLHHREVTYSATLPAGSPAEARAVYEFLSEVLLAALSRLGVSATRPSGTVAIPPGLRPCFDVPAEHEIAVAGRKLVGSAQWRHGGALLQHGSILVRDDQGIIGELLNGQPAEAEEPLPGAATLADSLGLEPAVEDVARPLLQSLEEATGGPVQPWALEGTVDSDVRTLERFYEDDAWTWRR